MFNGSACRKSFVAVSARSHTDRYLFRKVCECHGRKVDGRLNYDRVHLRGFELGRLSSIAIYLRNRKAAEVIDSLCGFVFFLSPPVIFSRWHL